MASRKAIDRAGDAAKVASDARPLTRIERARGRMLAGDWAGAFRGASKAASLSDNERAALVRAYEATLRPTWCRELGQDPDAIVEAGKAILRRLWP